MFEKLKQGLDEGAFNKNTDFGIVFSVSHKGIEQVQSLGFNHDGDDDMLVNVADMLREILLENMRVMNEIDKIKEEDVEDEQ